jgi:hypothetical protein
MPRSTPRRSCPRSSSPRDRRPAAGPVASFTVPFGGSATGDLLVVTIADHTGAAVSEIVDSTGALLTSASVRAVESGTASELWYELGATAATSVTVAMSPASKFDVWVTTTVANEVVVSVMMAAAPLFVKDVRPPFTSLFAYTGNDTGVLVAAQPGTYAMTFDIASGSGMTATTCASTAAWRPAP